MNPSIKPFWVVIGFDSSMGKITILGFGREGASEVEARCRDRISMKGDKVHLRAFNVMDSNLAPDMLEWFVSLGVKTEDALAAVLKTAETMLKALKG